MKNIFIQIILTGVTSCFAVPSHALIVINGDNKGHIDDQEVIIYSDVHSEKRCHQGDNRDYSYVRTNLKIEGAGVGFDDFTGDDDICVWVGADGKEMTVRIPKGEPEIANCILTTSRRGYTDEHGKENDRIMIDNGSCGTIKTCPNTAACYPQH